MTDEVHVKPSQADAAKMIIERDSVEGKETPEAIRKIAEVQVGDPPPRGTDLTSLIYDVLSDDPIARLARMIRVVKTFSLLFALLVGVLIAIIFQVGHKAVTLVAISAIATVIITMLSIWARWTSASKRHRASRR